jgi:hypothetical protein
MSRSASRSPSRVQKPVRYAQRSRHDDCKREQQRQAESRDWIHAALIGVTPREYARPTYRGFARPCRLVPVNTLVGDDLEPTRTSAETRAAPL